MSSGITAENGTKAALIVPLANCVEGSDGALADGWLNDAGTDAEISDDVTVGVDPVGAVKDALTDSALVAEGRPPGVADGAVKLGDVVPTEMGGTETAGATAKLLLEPGSVGVAPTIPSPATA